ncbi:MAG: alpha/beta hydrolase, partial [Myxococcota bacterium]
ASTGRVAFYFSPGAGAPVLLIHSVNAAASSFEMKTVFDALRGIRPVYALELPGFGQSARPAFRYSIRTYVDAILALSERAHDAHDGPVDAIALSLSSEFLARAAVERPKVYRRLALINPTGFSRGSNRLRSSGETREVPGFPFFFERRPWSRPLFDLLTTRASVRYFMRRTFGSKDVAPELIDYAYATARPAGAEHAPFSFLSGRLFAKDIRLLYEQLELPVWVPHGTRGDFEDFSESGWAEARGNWSFEAFASGAMPHWEKPEQFEVGLRRWLEGSGDA